MIEPLAKLVKRQPPTRWWQRIPAGGLQEIACFRISKSTELMTYGRWLLHCRPCHLEVPCTTWDVAVLAMGMKHDTHQHIARSLDGMRAVAAVVYPMTGQPIETLAEWRRLNRLCGLPEQQGDLP